MVVGLQVGYVGLMVRLKGDLSEIGFVNFQHEVVPAKYDKHPQWIFFRAQKEAA